MYQRANSILSASSFEHSLVSHCTPRLRRDRRRRLSRERTAHHLNASTSSYHEVLVADGAGSAIRSCRPATTCVARRSRTECDLIRALDVAAPQGSKTHGRHHQSPPRPQGQGAGRQGGARRPRTARVRARRAETEATPKAQRRACAERRIGQRRDEDGEATGRAIVKRSVAIAGHRTSVSLEQPFWDELQAIATAARRVGPGAGRRDRRRARAARTSPRRIRVFVLGRGEGSAAAELAWRTFRGRRRADVERRRQRRHRAGRTRASEGAPCASSCWRIRAWLALGLLPRTRGWRSASSLLAEARLAARPPRARACADAIRLLLLADSRLPFGLLALAALAAPPRPRPAPRGCAPARAASSAASRSRSRVCVHAAPAVEAGALVRLDLERLDALELALEHDRGEPVDQRPDVDFAQPARPSARARTSAT